VATCPRCNGLVAATAAACPHCEAYLLEWDPVSGRLSPRSDPPDTDADAPAAPVVFGPRRRAPALGNNIRLTVLRAACAIGMALHGLLVLVQLVDPTLVLLAWIALWLPLDGLWRSTRPSPYSRARRNPDFAPPDTRPPRE